MLWIKESRLLCIGDIHGEIGQLNKLLKLMNFREGYDFLILLGDYIDRGDHSKEVLDKLKRLKDAGRCTFLYGNHEIMMYDYVDGKIPYELAAVNGLLSTISSYNKDLDRLVSDLDYLGMVYYYMVGDLVFVHAGIDINKSLKEQDEEFILWARGEFLQQSFSNYDRLIVAGHTPFDKPMIKGNLLLIDTGCGKQGYLTGVDLTEGVIYTTENGESVSLREERGGWR